MSDDARQPTETRGRLVAPVGLPDRGQMLTVIEKTPTGELIKTPLIPVRFSPLQGGERI